VAWTWRGLDFADARAEVAGFVRLATSPTRAAFWTYLVVPSYGVIVVRDHEVPVPRQGLEIRADGLWAELVCETPGEHWTFGLEAFGVALDDPLAAPLDSWGAEIGDRTAVGFDLEWESPRAVHGEILVARERLAFEGGGVLVEGAGAWPPVVASTAWCVGAGTGDASVAAAMRIPFDDGRALVRSLVRGNGSVGWTTALAD
jgi:hypothetical protein